MRTALVTGAAKRIGRAIAARLLDEGYQVILHAHSSFDELTSWVAAHPKKSQVIELVSADLATQSGQDLLVERIQQVVKTINLVVHNASLFYPSAFSEVKRDAMQEMLAVNLIAPYFITQGLLKLLASSHTPSVINIVDAMWERPSPHYSHYAVSKAGLTILTRALANELAPTIRVNAIAPGAIIFPAFHGNEIQEQTLSRIPQKKIGNPSDIAQAVLFLDGATYATGEILVIDGGRSIMA